MVLFLHIAGSLILSFAIMALWVAAAERMSWSFFTGWGMVHGGFAVAFPVSLFIAFTTLAAIPAVRRAWRRGRSV